MFVEHLAGYFTDYGEAATLNGVNVTVIFDDGGTTVMDGEIATTQPQITITTAEVVSSGADQGSICFVRGANYKLVMAPTEGKDGTGISVLQLERQ